MKYECPTIQKAMNVAYNRWQVSGDLAGCSKEEFLSRLTDVERAAVVIGNLNYQVENGGWGQWWDNRYAASAEPYLEGVIRQIDTPTSREVLKMVEIAYSGIREYERDQSSRSWCDDYDDGYDDGPSMPSSSAYYEINDQFMMDAEAWFASWSLKQLEKANALREALS